MSRKKLTKAEAQYRKKRRNAESATRKLVAKALKDKPKHKPVKGYKYLENCKPGTIWTTQGGIKGVLVNCHTNANVIIFEVPPYVNTEDANYYLGKNVIAAKTEVKVIREES